MGNEGSMEGGEGLGGYPEGMVGDGKGGFSRIPSGMEADMSQLSEEERKQIAAVMSRAQELPQGKQTDRPPLRNPNIDGSQSPKMPSKPPDPGPTGLSKSRTVDAFKTEIKTPGRSPSTISLREPRSKPDIKEDQKSSVMTGFLTDSSPLSMVSSVVNKFNPFDTKSDPGSNQEESATKQRVAEKEQEKHENLKGNTSHQLQKSPGLTQHPQDHGRHQSSETSKPSQQQSRRHAQPHSDTRQDHPEQGSSNVLKQPLNTTNPLPSISTPKGPLPHSKEPIKSETQKPTYTTSLAQGSGPKRESINQVRQEQNEPQSGPSKQLKHSMGVVKDKPQTTDPAKKLTEELEKPKQAQGTAKQNVQQVGSTKPPSQQALISKQMPQQTTIKQQPALIKEGLVTQPTKQQIPASTPVIKKQTAQKEDNLKSTVTNQLSQISGKPVPPIEQQGKVPKPTPELKKPHQDPPLGISAGNTKIMCPLCNTTELLLHSKEKANYNTCTQCHSTVCSLCGFNPNPHITEINEWLCLNCQMQRALGMDMTSGPVPKPQPIKEKSTTVLSSAKPTPETHTSSQKEITTGTALSLTQDPKTGPSAVNKKVSMTDSAKTQKTIMDPHIDKLSSEADMPHIVLPEKGSQQTKQIEAHQNVFPSPVLQKKSESPLPKVSTLNTDMDKKLTDTGKPLKDAQVAEEKAHQPDKKTTDPAKTIKDTKLLKDKPQQPNNLPPSNQMQELKQSAISSPHPKIPPKPDSSQVKENPKNSPAKINPKVDSKQVPKVQETGGSPKSSPVHKPVVQQTPLSTLPSSQSQKSQDQPRRFSLNLGSTAETPKHQPTTPQETVTGKLFGFGASIFSQASSFISTATQPIPQPQSTQSSVSKQPPPVQKATEPPKSAKEATQAPQSPKTQATKKETKPLIGEKTDELKSNVLTAEAEENRISKKENVKETGDLKKTTKVIAPVKSETIPAETKVCPLCKTELKTGSKDQCNFNTCTQCKKIVCNMCGFNPTPHLTEVVEWLCLNCQTQRAMAGQLGDISKVSSPLGLPSKSSPKQAQKVTTLPSEARKTANDQEIKKDVPKLADAKLDAVPVEHIYNKIAKQDAPPSCLLDEVKKSLAPLTEDVSSLKGQKNHFVSDNLLELKEGKEETVSTVPSEGKITPKQDLTIDLSATVLREIDEERYGGRKKTETHLVENEAAKEKSEKEDDKSDTSISQQQKSPQGLSDTGYSSDGISGSLGEIPSIIPSDEKELHKEQTKCQAFSHDSSPSSPSDLAKLESTVLSILEAQTSLLTDVNPRKGSDLYGTYSGHAQDRVKTRILPITPESLSSEEEELEDIQEEDEETLDENGKVVVIARKSHKDHAGSGRDMATRRRRDSLDDSSESENSPVPQRKRRTSNGSSSSDDYKHDDSQGSGDDEEFIRKQIIEMSADEDASGSEDDEFIRKTLKEISGTEKQKIETKTKSAVAKCKRLTKKSSASYDDDGIRRHSWHHGDEEDEDEETYDESPEPKYRESKSQENEEIAASGGRGLRRFKTIELNSTISTTYSDDSAKKSAILYYDEEPELEMESLTDSPEDRSREERSSSLHASSFTPGTSPTSVSSLDEDSDSSPSHKKISGESKQQRKARHRSHGPVLPTIEDSSEEEELREEEELLKEQEKQRELEQQQRKSTSKKSKKDKDELRAQRRRERPKTPPSNLSPIEDASPTEELRQAAEMEELHRSSCSEYSPSIESEPEGFEISPEKIIEVQKVYKLPTSVSLYSPTDVTTVSLTENKNGQSLKSAEEAYEEILCKAKLYQHEKERDDVFEKEPLYGGMLIEDYIYESLVEENFDESLDTTMLSSQDNIFEHRVKDLKKSADAIGADDVANVEDECFTAESFHSFVSQEDIVSSSYIVPESHEIIILENTDEKQPQDSGTIFYELLDCQNMQLTPGSSPTQILTEICKEDKSSLLVSAKMSSSKPISCVPSLQVSLPLSNAISIPDVRITQHFTAEEQEDDITTEYSTENMLDSTIGEESAYGHSVPSEDDKASLEFKNVGQTVITAPRGVSFPTEQEGIVLKTQNESIKGITPIVICSSSGQVCSDSPHITKCDLINDTPSTDHVIISVPDVMHISEVKRITDDSSLKEKQGRRGVIRTSDVAASVNISEAKRKIDQFDSSSSSAYSLNLSDNKTVECLSSDKQLITSTVVTYAVTPAPKPSSVTSTAPSVTSMVKSLFRSSSSESSVPLTTSTTTPPPPPPPPPLPPPTLPKPTVYAKKRQAPKIPETGRNAGPNTKALQDKPIKNNATKTLKQHPPPPPVPPKPSSIPPGLVFSHRSTEDRVIKAVVSEQKKRGTQQKVKCQPLTSIMTLNLIPSTECKLSSPTSPLSPHSNKSSPRLTKPSMETYVVITLPSEPGTPTETFTAQTTTCWPLQIPPEEQIPRIKERVSSETSCIKDGKLQTSSDSNIAQFSLSQLITTEITKKTDTLSSSSVSDLNGISTNLQAENTIAEKSQIKEIVKSSELNNIMDLRTLKMIDHTNTETEINNCMDLSSTSFDMKRQSQGSFIRPISAVQPAIVNLSSASPVISSVALAAESITIVTCTTTVSYTTSLDNLVDLGSSMKAPLKLTTSKQYENGSSGFTEEVPINLSLGTPTHSMICATTMQSSFSPSSIINGSTDISTSQESVDSGVVDLSTTKSHRTMVTVDENTSEILTEIIEDDKPVDLTAGRRAVCCDVVYRLPFGRSCISQQSSTNLPEDRFGYRDDHYQYDRSGNSGLRGVGGMKPSMSDTNLAEAGLFLYKSKNTFDYPIGLTEAAVDLTSGKMTTGETLDYQTKNAGLYPETRQVISGIGISGPQYSQARMTMSVVSPYGSVLRSSNGVVYSSVATPVPSPFAITSQPESIFSTNVRDLNSFVTTGTDTVIAGLHQSQPQHRSYNMLNTTISDINEEMTVTESSIQSFPGEVAVTTSADLVSILTSEPDSFSELTEEECSFVMPSEDGKQQQLNLQRELLELEKLKQQRLAEELEWERQEIQRFREQETLMVQKKLEELQSMKQHLLFQQEEERQAQYMMRQETIAQQQLHLEQIQQLQHQLHQQLEEQNLRQMYQYSYDPNDTTSPQTTSEQAVLESQFGVPEDNHFWANDPHTSTTVSGVEMSQNDAWYTVQSDGITQYIPRPGVLNSVSEMSLKEIDINEVVHAKKRSSAPRMGGMYDELESAIKEEPRSYKLIVDSGVQTDDEDGAEKAYTGKRRRSKKGVDTSVQTDDEDQEEWDISTRSRRRSRAGKYSEGNIDAEKARQFSKVSSIAVQTVAEISVQTEPLGKIRIPSVRARDDSKIEIIKHISAPEKNFKGESLACQTEGDTDSQSPQYLVDMSQKDKRRPTPLEIGYSSHLRAESSLQVAPSPPKSPKVLYSPLSPVSPSNALETAFVPYEKTIVDDISCQHTDITQVPPPSPKATKIMQRSMSDPKPLSPTAEDLARTQFQYSDGYMSKTIQSGTQKKVKRTLPNPPPEEANSIQLPYGTVGSVSRRRICRTTTMARAKILQDIDRELDLVERESSKLRKKQAELDEEEKEIDAKLRYLEMGINRRKEALLKEREKRERAYLQGVAEERDYMSDSEVNNTRPTRIESHLGLDRPQTAPQSEYSPYLPPQTQSETQFAPPTSPYTQYQYQTPTLLTQAPTQFSHQSPYQQPLFQQQVSSYQTQPTFQAVPTMSFTPQQQSAPTQQPSYQHQSQMILLQQKTRQSTLDLDSKIPSHYDVIRNQPLIITPVSADSDYSVSHLGSTYSTLDLRLGLEEKSSMASSPMSSISAESFYADLEHHASRNYVLIDDIGELTKGSGSLSSAFGLHEKELSKADRILRSVDARRSAEVSDFLAPLTASTRLHSYGKADEDSMEDPYELKLLKHQIKQEFRRGTDSLDPLAGYSPYYHSDSLYRHFPKNEKYSISRLTLEKQAAKQLPPAILYQKQSKHKKTLIDPKMSKFSPIQEARDIEHDYTSYLSSSTSSIPSISSKVRLLQDDITYGLRKNITDQQKFLGPALAQNLGTTLSPTLRTSMQDEVDKPYISGSRSRPSSRPSSIYGLDLSIKRELSSSSLRLKANEAEALDNSFSHVAPSGRTKPSSLPISQSRGRIPIVAQNSEEESPLSPVGQPMGMARAAAGPLPPISADSRDQFGSSHSLPEVQQHMREESRTRGYDRDIAFIMDDFQHAMSDSEAYHLRREETDWFDKPREQRLENGHGDRKLPDKLSHSRPSHQQEKMNGKPIQYHFPHLRLKLQRDPKDHTVSGNGFGLRIVGGKEIPGSYGEIGAYIAKILPGGSAEYTGKLTEGMQVLEWNGYSLTEKTYEEVHSIISQSTGEAEICVRLDINMLSNAETPQNSELHEPSKPVDKTKSPGVDPKQLAAELQKVSQQQTPASALEKGSYVHSGTTSAASSAVPSPGQPGSPSVSKKRHSSKSTEAIKSHSHPITGDIQLQVNYDKHLGNLIIHILQARNLIPRDNNGYSDPFVKVYLLPGRGAEYKRRTKHVQKSLNPEWNQTVIYKNISMEQIKKKTLEVTVWDYDRFSSNDFLGEVLIDLSNPSSLDNIPRWYPLKEQSESIEHAKPHSGQGTQQVPKPSVIKSRSHGIFPDPSKDMQVPTIEKSHSSPGSSKSSSEGHLRSHGPSRSQSKTSVTQTHLEDAGAAIAAAEAAVQQLRLQPSKRRK